MFRRFYKSPTFYVSMKVCIAGASGVIGTVLTEGLCDKYDLLLLDKKPGKDIVEIDLVEERSNLERLLRSVDCVVHLAWDMREDGHTGVSIPENRTMAENVYRASLEAGVSRVIVASSVHYAIGYVGYPFDRSKLKGKSISESDPPWVMSPYGGSKVHVEMLGRGYSKSGFKIIAARFGHVTENDQLGEVPFMLFHEDCVDFVDRCIVADNLPNFSAFYAVSDNEANPFDLTNARELLGYVPKQGATFD